MDVTEVTAEMIRACPLAIGNGHHYRVNGECLCVLDLAAGPGIPGRNDVVPSHYDAEFERQWKAANRDLRRAVERS